MSKTPDNSPAYLTHQYAVPALLLLANFLVGCGVGPSAEASSGDPTPAGTPTMLSGTETQTATPTTTPTPESVFYPPTGIIYQRTTVPEYPSASGWTCLVVPKGGTAYGGLAAGGTISNTILDSEMGVVIRKDREEEPIAIDLRISPKRWDRRASDVQPGTTTCSK